MPQEEKQNGRMDARSGMNLFYFLAQSHATCVSVFLRRDFGIEALGLNGLMALVMILLYGLATNDRAMFGFFVAWLIALIWQRLNTFRLVRSGWVEHSRYSGYPVVALKLPFMRSEIVAKNVGEPALCILIGSLLCPISETIGGFVMLGFVSMMFQRAIESQINMMRVRRMRDAQIEQSHLAAMYRGDVKDY